MADDDRPTDGLPSDDTPDNGDTPDDGDTDDTREWRPDEDHTAEGDTAEGDTAALPSSVVWSGRARVPVAGGAGQPDEWEPVAEPGGPWWLPVALAALALVVLGVLAAGIWLIADALREEPAPVLTPSPTLTESPTPSPTPEAPPPTPEATPPEPSPTPEPTPPPTPEPTPTPSPTGEPTPPPPPDGEEE